VSVAPVDAVLVAGCLLFALSGLRHGFLVGMASSAGVIGGGLLGVVVAPVATRWPLLSELPRLLVAWPRHPRPTAVEIEHKHRSARYCRLRAASDVP